LGAPMSTRSKRIKMRVVRPIDGNSRCRMPNLRQLKNLVQLPLWKALKNRSVLHLRRLRQWFFQKVSQLEENKHESRSQMPEMRKPKTLGTWAPHRSNRHQEKALSMQTMRSLFYGTVNCASLSFFVLPARRSLS
jgi:hypothetical protein